MGEQEPAAKAEPEVKDPSVQPVGYWWVKIILGLAIAALAGLELFSDQSVSPMAFAALLTLAGGPEVAAFFRKGGS